MSARQQQLPLSNLKAPDLRPYQKDFVTKVNEAWMEYRSVLAVLPTGAGKSLAAGMLVKENLERGGKTLFLAHTRKLVAQFRHVTEEDYGISGEIEMGEMEADTDSPLICSTIQTMGNRVLQSRYGPNHFSLVVLDEAHRSLGNKYQEVCNHFAGAKILGITATPRRGDLRDLMDFFEHKAIDVPLSQLIKEGYLATLTIKNIPVTITLSKKEGGTGDYTDEEIGHAIEPYLEACADQLTDELGQRCGLVFLPLIDISKRFTMLLKDRGILVEHVDGNMRDKELELHIGNLKRGDIQVLCSSMILAEGIDIPPVSIILNLRPTRSWTLYVQIAGRCTRIFGDNEKQKIKGCKWDLKTNSVLLDPLWLCDQHSLLQRPSCLIAAHPEDVAEIDEAVKAGGQVDLLDAAESAAFSRSERLRERLEAMAKRKARLVNAMDFFLKINRLDIADYEPRSRWEFDVITEGQRQVFINAGIDIESIQNRGHAQQLIEMIIQRSKDGLATIKMAKYAESLGQADSWTRSFEDVSAFIGMAKKNKDPYEGIPD